MTRFDIIDSELVSRFRPELIEALFRPCRPRVLILVDGLSYRANHSFGLWRFLHAISQDAGVTNKRLLTLAHRSNDFALPDPDTVTIGTDTYAVKTNFRFDTASPAMTPANYDQVWIFAIGSGSFSLSNAEVGVLSEFMNGGGGVFATGDHAALGRALCGSLPRIRRMREWRDAASGGVPMGTEADANIAVNRIDTVTDPGADGRFDFEDQSDTIPQRIYPNYRVNDTDGLGGSSWEARIHPLLRLPGAQLVRSSQTTSSGGVTTTPNMRFTQDIDVLPDHPHESQCYEVTAGTVLNDAYNLSGQNFQEWRPSVANPAQRVGAEIVAYAVSGGRSVLNGVWKPPVKPRMFGVISAYDGRLAQPYPGKTQRPGRIVCDSTWHHYVNVNLDGTGAAPRQGLGSWSGGTPGAGTFTPSAALQKIFAYYRNILSWLQPANRTFCRLWLDLVAIRFRPEIFEELLDAPRLTNWRDLVGLGRDSARLLAYAHGEEAATDMVAGFLRSEPELQEVGDAIAGSDIARTVINRDDIVHGVLGAMLVRVATLLPEQADEKVATEVLAKGPQPHLKTIRSDVWRAIELGLSEAAQRIERSRPLLKIRPAKAAPKEEVEVV